MNLAQLNQQYAIPDQVEFVVGKGDLPLLRVSTPAAEALISLYGGQVLSFRPADHGRDLLFLSELAYFESGKAIKGGVPICWPWFGADPEQRGRAAHGFARNSLWSVDGVEQVAPDLIRVTLLLRDDAQTLAVWPHAFELRLVISISHSLELQLITRNTGAQPLQITQALHTYFSVGEIGQVEVHGLDGCEYLDKVRDFARDRQSGPITFAQEVDRIYLGAPDRLHIVDPAQDRTIHIAAGGSNTAVVWNPWEQLSRTMADLGDDDYRRLVCVETANAADEVITIDTDGEYALSASYRATTGD